MVFLVQIFCLLVGINEVPTQAYQDNYIQTNSIELVNICDGIIVMEADMMRVNISAPNTIVGVKIYDETEENLVWEENGCPNTECSYNLEALASGTYYVVVTIENGKTFNDFITLL